MPLELHDEPDSELRTGSQVEKASQRKEPRYSVPVHGIVISVEVFVGNQRYVGQLWDVSRSGACLRLFMAVPTAVEARIRIHEPSERMVIETNAHLIWINHVMGAYYLGMSFDQPIDLASTFLSPLLQNFGR